MLLFTYTIEVHDTILISNYISSRKHEKESSYLIQYLQGC